MTWLELSRWLTVFGSGIITLGLYDQARKVLISRSVDDLSTVLVISLIINESVWLNYGASLGEWPIMLISGANIPAVLMIMVGYFKYREGGARHKQRCK
ncbi:MAG: SemiSWEET family transporter [Patescibacteria group bacterium]